MTQRAYRALKEAIVSLELAPGATLSENALAEQLGASRSPVRQALKLLEHEGLVVAQPQRGTSVTRLQESEVQDAIVMRRVLEEWALGEAQRQGVRPELKVLERLLAEQANAVERRQYATFFDLDSQFHEAILGLAGNRKAVELFHQVNLAILRVRAWTLRRAKPLKAGVQEHRAIYEALRTPNWEEVRRLILAADAELMQALTDMRQKEPGLFEHNSG